MSTAAHEQLAVKFRPRWLPMLKRPALGDNNRRHRILPHKRCMPAGSWNASLSRSVRPCWKLGASFAQIATQPHAFFPIDLTWEK